MHLEDSDDTCDVPDGIALPVTKMTDLNNLGEELENEDATLKVVSCSFLIYNCAFMCFSP
jgi:hypothetical protein